MQIKDLELLSKSLAPVFKNFVDSAMNSLRKELSEDMAKISDELKSSIGSLRNEVEQIKAIEIPSLDLTPAMEDIERRFKEFEENIELPKDGTSVTLEDVAPLIDELAEKLIENSNSALNEAKVNVEAAIKIVEQMPIPKDGKSFTLEDAEPVLDEIKAEIYSKVSNELNLKLKEEVALIPVPKDGQSVTLEDVLPLLEEVKSELQKGVEVASKEAENKIAFVLEKAISELPVPVDGINGIDGKDGLDGCDGKDGEDGRDATQIEILPTIEEGKSYPRGTYAKHNNGLWRAFERTFGMRGWECIVSGIADIEIEQVGEKHFSIAMVTSEDQKVVKEFNLPVMLYKGVFKEADVYSKGDVVTWGGSAWHSNVDENKSKPGTNSDWTLTVKKGRDYKEPVAKAKVDTSKGVSIK